MTNDINICGNCGGQTLKGDICLRSSKDMEQIMVVRQDHGIEKKIPLQPKVCSQCGSVSFFVDNPKKKPGTNKTLYTIHSCGCDKSKSKCNKDKDTITALEAIVTRTVE